MLLYLLDVSGGVSRGSVVRRICNYRAVRVRIILHCRTRIVYRAQFTSKISPIKSAVCTEIDDETTLSSLDRIDEFWRKEIQQFFYFLFGNGNAGKLDFNCASRISDESSGRFVDFVYNLGRIRLENLSDVAD